MTTTTTSISTGIMTGIPSPAALHLPPLSFSAPVSRAQSPPAVVKRKSQSRPESPVSKRPVSPIAKKVLAPVFVSPTRALRKHSYHVPIAQHNPREVDRELVPSCPVHSYATMEAEISVLPKGKSTGGVKFGDTPRALLQPTRSNCPVHVYAEAKSTLSSAGATPLSGDFSPRDAFQKTHRGATPVHSYAAPASTLRRTGGAAFGSSAARGDGVITPRGLVSATLTPRAGPGGNAQHAPLTARPTLKLPKIARRAPSKGEGTPRGVDAPLVGAAAA